MFEGNIYLLGSFCENRRIREYCEKISLSFFLMWKLTCFLIWAIKNRDSISQSERNLLVYYFTKIGFSSQNFHNIRVSNLITAFSLTIWKITSWNATTINSRGGRVTTKYEFLFLGKSNMLRKVQLS